MGALNPARANQQTRDVLAEEDAMHLAWGAGRDG